MRKNYFAFLVVVLFNTILLGQSVDPSGAFNYSIPIEVPPGTGGLTPQLSLSYNSNGGNGMCGVGWSLSGLSVITRDLSYPVNFDDDDHYLLDGQKLIEISDAGTYREYRTERESFLHIRGYNLNTADSYWEVKAKNGRVMYYGRPDSQHDSSNDGHVDAVGQSGKARVWSVSHVEDTKGNYYYVTYLEDDENGDYYPDQIVYTQNNENLVEKVNRIQFTYDLRNMVEKSHFPTKTYRDLILSSVGVYINVCNTNSVGTLVKNYSLNYDISAVSYLSRLRSLELSIDGNVKEIEFDWYSGINIKNCVGTVPSISTSLTPYPGDFNGDGEADILLHDIVSGETFIYLIKKGIIQPASFHATSFHEKKKPYLGDFNGDGVTDILFFRQDTGSIVIYPVLNGVVQGATFSASSFHENKSLYLGDYNGDGVTDLFFHRTSTGTAVIYPVIDGIVQTATYSASSFHENKIPYPGDYNGDGVTDLLFFRIDTGAIVIYPVLDGVVQTATFSASSFHENKSLYPGDYNGDGVTDLFFHRSSTGSAVLYLVENGKVASTTFSASSFHEKKIPYPADFNGDGTTDLLFTRYSTGTTYLYPVVNGLIKNSIYYAKSSFQYAKLFFGDFNGDGTTDIFKRQGTGHSFIYPSTVSCPDLMEEISTANGAIIKPEYTPTPQVDGAICPENSSKPIIANPSPRMLVTQLTVDDGLDNTIITDYTYHNGLFKTGYRYDRKNLGFEWVEKYNQQTGLTTRTWYNQDPDTFYGLVEKTEVYRGTDYTTAEFFSVKENTYELNSTSGAIELRRVVERFYNFTDTPVTTMVEYPSYDSYGNRLTSVDYGEVSWPDLTDLDPYDNITKEVEYITLDSESRYISVPSTEQTHAYTLDGLLTTVSETRYLYDGDTAGGYVDKGMVTRKEFENGLDDSAMEYGYDDYGNLIWTDDARTVAGEVTPASGHAAQLTYDSDYATYVVSKTDVDGNTETVEYDEKMQPVIVTDVNGVDWQKEYDVFGRVIAEIAPGDSVTEPTKRYTYSDPLADPPHWIKTEVKDSVPGADPVATYLEAYIYYDGLGRELQRKSEATGGRWTTIDTHYDSAGRTWKTSVPYYSTWYYFDYNDERNSSERVFSEKLYDDVGRVIEEIYPDGTSTKMMYGKQTSLTMDPAGHISARTISGRDVYEYTYADDFSSSWDYLDVETFIDSYTYYSFTKVSTAGDATTITDQDGNVITTELDMLGQKTSYDDPDKGLWSYIYDKNGNLISQLDAEGNSVSFSYDDQNRVSTKTVNGDPAATYTYGTDATAYEGGRLVSVSFDGNSDAFTYDQRGRVTTHTRELAGIIKTMQYTQYDSMDRLRRELNPDGEELIHTYLDDGNLSSLENSFGYAYISALDYEPFGKIAGFTFGNGVTTEYGYYDGSDSGATSYRLKSIDIAHSGITIGSTAYEYDSVDNITQKSFTDDFNGAYTENFTYDYQNRLSSYTTDIRGTAETKAYAYDDVNNIYQKNGLTYLYGGLKPHAVTELQDNGSTIRTFEYNANGDMTRATNYTSVIISAGAEGLSGAQPVLELWVGDKRKTSWRLNDEDVRNYTWNGYWDGIDPIYVRYASDQGSGSADGVRVDRIMVNGETVESNDPTKVYFVTGTFNPVNGISGLQTVTLSDDELMDQYGAFRYSGISAVPEERQFNYDGENRLIRLEIGSEISDYSYDPSGERISSSESGGTTYFFFTGYEVRVEGTTTTVTTGYFANTMRIAQRKSVYENSVLSSEELLYIHTDHLGSAVRMTDESGDVVSSLAYSPFGETIYAAGDEETPYQFTGQHNDGNGIYYFHARYYDPVLGRFLQADSVLDGLNRYAYCGNNPVVYTDPTGLCYTGENFDETDYYDPEEHDDDEYWELEVLRTAGDTRVSPAEIDRESSVANQSEVGSGWAYVTNSGVDGSREDERTGRELLPTSWRDLDFGWTSYYNAYVYYTDGNIIAGTTSLLNGVNEGLLDSGLAILGAAGLGGLEAEILAPLLAGRGLDSFNQAGKYGIRTYNDLKRLIQGTGLQAHHLIEKRFKDLFDLNVGQMASIALTPAEHQIFTNAWRELIPYGPSGTGLATRESVLQAAQIVYKNYPDILKAIGF